jgi:hypothetical protein
MSIFADDLHQSLQRAAKLTEEPSLRPRQSGRSWLVRESRPQRSCRALIACIENGGIAVGGRGDGRSVLSRRQRLRRLLLLRLLLLLQGPGGEVRVFETRGTSFHLKAYVFAKTVDGELIDGTAFIGSSNISRQALQDGLEWNYRVAYPGDSGFLEARQRFAELFVHPRTVSLSDAWISDGSMAGQLRATACNLFGAQARQPPRCATRPRITGQQQHLQAMTGETP